MKDMSIIANKKIINKETNEVRLVVSIDEENRKIHSVPVDEPNAEPSIMAAASYDRRWKLYEEPEAEVSETAEPEVNHDEPMKMSDVVTKLESLFDILNRVYFDNALPKPVITVQSTPKAYGHCSTKKIWKSENDGQYEINIGAEFLNRPSANTAATMCHEMVHLYCLVNEIQDTCQKGRYHNKTFKAEAEARDLEIGYDRTVGFSHTNPTEAFKKTLEDNGFVLEVRQRLQNFGIAHVAAVDLFVHVFRHAGGAVGKGQLVARSVERDKLNWRAYVARALLFLHIFHVSPPFFALS